MRTSKMVLHILNVCIGILVFMLVVFGLVKLGNASYTMGYRVFMEPPMAGEPGEDKVIEVTEGMSSLALGRTLQEKGLVDNAYLFVIQMQLSAYAKKVKPGTYTLNTSQTAREMLIIMSADHKSEDTNRDS